MTEQNISKTINNSSIVQSDLKNKINKRKQYDHSFKIVLIGDSGVGKSCILLRFADDKFNDNFYTTVGVDFRFKSVDINDKTIKYEIWDTAGQERFKTITSAYYRGADCVIIVYDVTDKQSFQHVPEWIDEVKKMNKDNPLMIVLGNKSDVEQKEVQENDISEFIERYGIEVIEASAKSAFNIDTIMKKIGVDLLKKLENKPKKSKLEDNTTYKLSASDKEKQNNKLIKKCNCA